MAKVKAHSTILNSENPNNPNKQIKKAEKINYDEWEKFISYYRKHIDDFAIDILGLKLFPIQRVILRAMAKYQNSMFIACRGIGKSWLTAVFFICSAILYPNIKLGIASGNSQQARNVIIQKIKGELAKNPTIANEIVFPIKTATEDCVVEFKNGSEIRAITLAQDRGGDSARSWRFHYILIDEARLVKDDIIEEILIPMTKTKRNNAFVWDKHEKGKVIYISSAYLKTHPIYNRFKYHYEEMVKGNDDYFACTIPYQVGVQAGLFDEEDILKELEKPTMTKEKFDYEYNAVFVGSNNSSFYPYEVTEPCRTLSRVELEQPKNAKNEYIITHDVAVSDNKNADNICTHVIKLKPQRNGTYIKEVVFSETQKGVPLPKQRDYLRELLHIKFPNTSKLIIDMRGNGEPLPSLFYESWQYVNEETKEVTEFPPLILDNDKEAKKLIKGAIPIIKGITATHISNNTMYTYMKSCFEDKSLKILRPSTEVDSAYKEQEISYKEYITFVQADVLMEELSNIKQVVNPTTNNVLYERIEPTLKRDRATSLAYGLSYVQDLEIENKMMFTDEDDDETLVYF